MIGLGAGIFFLGYFLLEIPGSLIVERWGARRWICRIMLTWGVMAALTAFVRTPMEFYGVRFLLGLAEAGFFPGVIVYRFSGPLFYANCRVLRERVEELVGTSVQPLRLFVLDASAIVELDLVACEALSDLHGDLRARGIRLAIASLHGSARDRLIRGWEQAASEPGLLVASPGVAIREVQAGR